MSSEDNETNWLWREIKKDRAKYKEGNRDEFKARLKLSSVFDSHKITELTPYQFRIDDSFDFYPSNKKWHNLKTGERGQFRKIEDVKKLLEES